MALDIGGSSTYNAANWELLDIEAQGLLSINPTKTGGNGCNDPNATATNDSTCYWQSYRKDAFATETAWGPNDDVMVSMYKSKLYFNTVAAEHWLGDHRPGRSCAPELGDGHRSLSVGSVLEPRRLVPGLHVVQHAPDRRLDREPRRPQRRPQEGGPDRDCRRDAADDHGQRAGPRAARLGQDQLLPVRQRGQQLRGLQPEHLRQRSRRQLRRDAPATAPEPATVTTTRRPSCGGSPPQETGPRSASTTPTVATPTTTTPGRASAPT